MVSNIYEGVNAGVLIVNSEDKPWSLSVKLLIQDHNKRYLLLRRSAKSEEGPGKWDLPGGKVEGEDLESAANREVKEETGLTVPICGVLCAFSSETTSARVANLVLNGRFEGEEVHLSNEHDEYLWVNRDELMAMDSSSLLHGCFRSSVGSQD